MNETLPHWLSRLASLELAAVEVGIVFPRPVEFRDPVCAVVRGLLGERLRDLARPVYDAYFESETDPGRTDGLVPPYWLSGLPAERGIEAGRALAAMVVAIGPAVSAIPYFDVALREALGRLGRTSPTLGVSRRSQPRFLENEAPATILRIETSTPLLLRGDREACAAMCPGAPEVALLARAGVRRLDALLRAYGPPGPVPRVAFPDLTGIQVVEGRLAPWKGSRYSLRQKRRFPLAGLDGTIALAGDPVAELAPLFGALAITGVGKATTMGFGVLAARTS